MILPSSHNRRPQSSAPATLVGFLLPVLLLASCGMGWQRRFPVGAELYGKADGRPFGRVLAFEEDHDFSNGMGPQAAVLIELDGPADEPTGHPHQLWAGCGALSAFYEVGPKKGPSPAAR